MDFIMAGQWGTVTLDLLLALGFSVLLILCVELAVWADREDRNG